MVTKSLNNIPWIPTRLVPYLPAILGFLVYALLTLNHGFVLDDNLVITSHSHVQDGFSGIGQLFTTNYSHGHSGFNDGLYRPLSLVTFAIEKSITGINPAISHLLQALLYALSILFLYRWLLLLLGPESKWPFWISMVFAMHPIHTEVVANLKSRDEIMALLFFVLSLHQFTHWLQSKDSKRLVFSALWFLLALFSKESAVTYLAAFPMLMWMQKVPLQTGFRTTAIMVLPVGLFLAVRQKVLADMGPVDEGIISLLQNSLVQAAGPLDQLAGAAYIQWMYFSKLLFPFELSHDYSYNAIQFYGLGTLPGAAALLGVIVIVGLGVFGFVNRKWYGYGALLYFATCSVVANAFFLIGATAAERFVFSPSLGWSFVIVAGFTSTPFLRKWSHQTLALYCAIFMLLTVVRIPDWKSDFALFKADVKKVSNSARAHYNYGSALIEEAKRQPSESASMLSEAQKHLFEAIEILPEYQDAYNNLGIAYMNDNRLEEAVNVYKELLGKFPQYGKGRYNMANCHYKLKQYALAEAQYEIYYANNPSNLDALFMSAECEGFQQKFQEAIEHLNVLVTLEPNRDRSWLKLGLANATLGNLNEAASSIKTALQLNPRNTEARMNLALIYANSGNANGAINELQIILASEPANERAKQLLANLQQQAAGQ